jgi:peptide deformylase
VGPNDPILHEPTERFDFTNPQMDPLDLASDLAQTMLANSGIGIAANQCGIPYRVLVLLADDLMPMFNPRIVDFSEETIVLEEGCLTFPGLLVKVKRPRKIRVRFTLPDGNTVTKVFDGMTSRCIQHEIDHLDGVCHIERASIIHREQAMKKLKKAQRQTKRS